MSDEKKVNQVKAPGYVRDPKDVPSGDEKLAVKQDKIRKERAARAGKNGSK